tara:strand:- start:1271 stop:1399 length:129 start_codon:yes stop_codon:yes gene_type:complete
MGFTNKGQCISLAAAVTLYNAAADGFEAGANAVVEAHYNMYH